MSSAALPCHYEEGEQRRARWWAWLPAVTLVTLAHAGVWFGYSWHSGQALTQPLPAVQVSLLTLPAPQEKPATVQAQRAPTPPKPQPAIARQPQAPAPTTEAAVPETSTPSAEATESPPSTAQEEYSQPLYNAAYLNNPPPVYPLAARRRGIEGTVVVRAQIQEDGHCLQANLSKSSGHEMLDRAAVAAVRAWRFTPAKRGTQSITAWVEVPITFRLTRQDEQTQSL